MVSPGLLYSACPGHSASKRWRWDSNPGLPERAKLTWVRYLRMMRLKPNIYWTFSLLKKPFRNYEDTLANGDYGSRGNGNSLGLLISLAPGTTIRGHTSLQGGRWWSFPRANRLKSSLWSSPKQFLFLRLGKRKKAFLLTSPSVLNNFA